MKEAAVTLSLDVLESLIGTAQRLHPGNLKPRDRKALAIAEREAAMVKQLAEEQAGQYARLPGYLPSSGTRWRSDGRAG